MTENTVSADEARFHVEQYRYLWAADQPLCRSIWEEKYRYVPLPGAPGVAEEHPLDSVVRIALTVVGAHPRERVIATLDALARRAFVPAGRIWSDVGTPKETTAINCFVMDTVPDDMGEIFRVLKESALTMQQGGGIGVDFSTLRPRGALLVKRHSSASGPLKFMDTWDSMCETIMSAGHRRGAMMACMSDWHPDILEFITAKRTAGRLRNFNVSVLVSDSLVKAVRADELWDLGFAKPRLDGQHAAVVERDGAPWYVYKRLRARELWEEIIRNTYEWSEPGVIFIDRVNERNNLSYCETIRATNPCGEQPLPPYGDCLLGAINLFALVENPFRATAGVGSIYIQEATRIAVRFLDAVNDVTGFPLKAQKREAHAKRRIGLGVMGLANALQALGLRYGSSEALYVTSSIFKDMKIAAYDESSDMADEVGSSFPKMGKQFLESPNIRSLPTSLISKIIDQGIRNGVLLTVAPTGTTSILAGNVSSGIEPTFARTYERTIRGKAGEMDRTELVHDAGWLAFCVANQLFPNSMDTWTREARAGNGLPEYMVTTDDLTVEEHVRMQAAAQEHVDASISKTVNCPEDMPFEDFRRVYDLAYDLGCKGCTTYRPSAVRGAVLRKVGDAPKEPAAPVGEVTGGQAAPGAGLYGHLLEAPAIGCAFCGAEAGTVVAMCKDGRLRALCPQHVLKMDSEDGTLLFLHERDPEVRAPVPRPRVLDGRTYKFKPGEHAYYVTVTHEQAEPRELFVSTKDIVGQEMGAVIGRLVSALMRKGGDVRFVAEELQQVHTPNGWHEAGRYWSSRAAAIGAALQEHLEWLDMASKTKVVNVIAKIGETEILQESGFRAEFQTYIGEPCPQCQRFTVRRQEGCRKCGSCGWSEC